MLAAALGSRKVSPFYGYQELQRMRAERYRAGNAPYPSWYLFGSEEKKISGLLETYTCQGYHVSLCPESTLPSLALQDFTLLDVQLCTFRLQQGKVQISGFLPEELSSKICQADQLYRQSSFRFLPAQRYYINTSEPLLPPSDAEVWILKAPTGSAGRCSEGHPYTVWRKAELARKLPSLLLALPAGMQIIVSEFTHTCDPYADFSDHVVHKMSFFSSRGKDGFTVLPYGQACQRFIYHCKQDKLALHGVLTLAEYIGQPKIASGNVEKIPYFPEFVRQLAFHGTARLIFSVDFLVPEDGLPRYLESNKLAATFAECTDPSLPPLIDMYPFLKS